jgi:HTH-type transcriptional regulator / antitoxin HipB
MKTKPTQAQTDLLETLAAARQSKGLSQAALAAKIGLPQPHLSRLERGINTPQLDTLQNLAGALDLQLLLVPRALGPLVKAIMREFAAGSRSPEESPAEERPLYRIQAEEFDGGEPPSDMDIGRADAGE